MLSADKNVTLTEFQIQTLQIREKELNYFVSLYNSISGSHWHSDWYRHRGNAGGLRLLVAQNAVSARHVHGPGDRLPGIHCECCRPGAVRHPQRCLLRCLRYAIWITMSGPGKFLRGQGGLNAAEQAVTVLEEKSEITLAYFMLGLYCIVLSSALKAFILYTLWNACIVVAGLCLMTYTLVTSGKLVRLSSRRKENIQQHVRRKGQGD